MKNKILKKTAAFLALIMTLSLSTAVFAETAIDEERIFTLTDWTKYTPCSELEIPKDKLNNSIIVGKLTGGNPLAVWSREELSEEEKNVLKGYIKDLPGIGNPKNFDFMSGPEASSNGMTILTDRGLISFERPSNWALLCGIEYEYKTIETDAPDEEPDLPEEPDISDDPNLPEEPDLSEDPDITEDPTEGDILGPLPEEDFAPKGPEVEVTPEEPPVDIEPETTPVIVPLPELPQPEHILDVQPKTGTEGNDAADGKNFTAAGEFENLDPAQLQKENPDTIGWITIEGTNIDYPVMRSSSDDPDFYLHRDFQKKESKNGLPYVNKLCSTDSNNILIYGHNMKNRTMFSDLLLYAEEDFFKDHPVIRFDTPDSSSEYEIIAAFYDRLYYQDEDTFKYYEYAGDMTEEGFADYVKNIKDKSLYDTENTPSYGEKLITLSTCAYHTKNGRFVVVARMKQA